jgi:zinc transport system substrate-binding protein
MNKNHFKLSFLALLLPLVLIAVACASEDSDSSEPKGSDPELTVLTTLFPMTYFSERVGGDRVSVESLIKAGIDAHDFEPTPGDIITIGNADVLVYNHPAFESWVESAVDAAANDSLIVVKTADLPDDVEFAHDHGDEDEHDDHDEHAHDDDEEHGDKESELVEAVGHVVEEVEHGDITADTGVQEIEDILHSFEGDHEGHDHEDEEHAEDHEDEEHEDEDHEGHEDEHADEEHLNELIEELEAIVTRVESGAVAADVGIEEIEGVLGEHDHGDHEGHDDEDGHDDHADEDEHDGHEHEEGADPHIWLNPLDAVEQVQAIQTAFSNADPDGSSVYSENADALISELLALDEEIISGLSSCELDHIVVSHEAYGHLAERYGFEQIGLQGLSTEGDTNPGRVAEIIDAMRDLGVTHVLQEPIAGSPLAETVAQETGSELLTLHPMESITPADIESGATYFSIMRANLESLRIALECS